ncbi:MAG TPA: hypothetical protein HA276_02605 [Candidatus Poseidoniaceae archaeon]|nr:MAG: hypothetical protein CBD01_000405 [Euryarchaeota archaeon TMED141]DAC10151.1 MAG TPA: hypothetical protein D7I09_04355 [Candidatus Poseidoniales archaeon]DAC18093.1 MAG TPA: hypothetical protein D7I01_02540 [Candidatus Poseidoniales archaeon]HII18554.1 hypothetical protein [Candidatus Poseidoniaceae archaeon]HII96559.1 hypothetical protein [Candidatus Poseidoniaceae archaeon]|tara:strand:- start:424 stop:1170 length:747 start_codon:yes stop_codon:yes gene_type:complete
MDDERSLPLFVLPMTLMPGEVTQLRVFEPRYKQMLDSCILDERPFGLILNDPFQPVRGWDGPRTTGTLAHIEEHEEAGSNHMLVVRGGQRFDVIDVIEPALPPFSDPAVSDLVGEDGFFPGQEALLARAEELGRADLPLHISANVRLRPQFEADEAMMLTVQALLRSTMSAIAGAMGIDEETAGPWVEARTADVVAAGPDGVFLAAAMVLPDLEARQQVLSSASMQEALAELEHGLLDIRRDLGLEEE